MRMPLCCSPHGGGARRKGTGPSTERTFRSLHVCARVQPQHALLLEPCHHGAGAAPLYGRRGRRGQLINTDAPTATSKAPQNSASEHTELSAERSRVLCCSSLPSPVTKALIFTL